MVARDHDNYTVRQKMDPILSDVRITTYSVCEEPKRAIAKVMKVLKGQITTRNIRDPVYT